MMKILTDIAMAFLGAAGFAIVFNVHDKMRILWTGIGGAISWIVYLIMLEMTQSVFWAMFVATAMIIFMSEILARTIHVPVIMMMVPMLIPMIPGGALYYTMDAVVRGNAEGVTYWLYSLAEQAGAIAVGIIVMTSIMGNFFTFYYQWKNKR